MIGNLSPESEAGSVEYKLYIAGSHKRMEGLKSQLNSRLLAGAGRATYWLGVRDDGVKIGLPSDLLQESLERLTTLVQEVGARVDKTLQENVTGNPFTVHHRLGKLLQIDSLEPRWVACVSVCRDVLVYPPIYLEYTHSLV